MKVLETERLIIRRLTTNDAEFILKLLNEPSWIQFIGDKGIKTLDDARKYIEEGPMAMYKQIGFGLFVTELKENGTPIGLCGLIKRDGLEDVDIGYAFLPAFWSKGYAYEAADAVKLYGKEVHGLKRLVAITSPDNLSSGKLLEKIGLTFERMIKLSQDSEEVKLFSLEL
ncbi:GNAT family N-acetyltransferase [Sutcliffiella rhizosphaerae]|uniref:Acetyltransferase n=1 Tax=Sutcliffiella rhizosphaerae TaxID=2880967 RepID=A0ABN8ABL9_9BACI|nr:GNAT family N-acetyltransferase [Sutcliffiella rhizosphaerae]CAG9621321.1 Acetyltransferase [Sutcliffiella rhizosphaerae]